MDDMSIIVRTYNRRTFTEYCLRALRAYTDFSLVREVMIGDCGSTDGTQELIRNCDFATVYEFPYGNVGANLRRGAELATAPYIAVVDNDVFVSEKWNRILLAALKGVESLGISILAYDTNDRQLEVNGAGERLSCGFGGYEVQPVTCVGGRIITSRELLLSENKEGLLGDPEGQYMGWWAWHQAFRGRIGVLMPRLGCFEMTRILMPPAGYEYIGNRRGEPLVEDLIREDPTSLKDCYVAMGWMRESPPDIVRV